MKPHLISLFLVCALVSNSPAAPAPSELDALTEKLRHASAGTSETDIIQLLKLAHATGRPFQAAPIAKSYLSQAPQPSAAVLLLGAENAWLTADYRTAVTRYKSYLRVVEANGGASAAAAQMYAIQLDFLGDKEDAYRTMKESGDEWRSTKAARRFDEWFLNEAKARSDLAATSKRLASAFADKLPLEQERYFYWEQLDWLLTQGTMYRPETVAALPQLKALLPLIRENPLRVNRLAFCIAHHTFLAGSQGKDPSTLEREFEPVKAAAQTYFNAAPTADTLLDIMMVFTGGRDTYTDALWNRQLAQKQALFVECFPRLSEADRERVAGWNSWSMNQRMASPAQWLALAAQQPEFFRKRPLLTAQIPFGVGTNLPAAYKAATPILQGIPSASAAVLNSLGASDDPVAMLQHLVRQESWYLSAGDIWNLYFSNILGAYAGQPRDAAQALPGDWQGQLIRRYFLDHVTQTPIAIFHPDAAARGISTVWGLAYTPEQKAQFADQLHLLDWVPYTAGQRKSLFGQAQAEFKQWAARIHAQDAQLRKNQADLAKALTTAQNSKAATVADLTKRLADAEAQAKQVAAQVAMVGPIEKAFQEVLNPQIANPDKAPNPVCQNVAKMLQAITAQNLNAYVAASRALYPLIRDYETKRTPLGLQLLVWMMENRLKAFDTYDFQCEVLADQLTLYNPQGMNRSIRETLNGIFNGRPGWGWNGWPKKEKDNVVKLNNIFAKALNDQMARNQFWGECFQWFRQSRSGHGWSNLDTGNELMEKMITGKTLLTSGYRPNSEIKSAACTYQWLIRGEFPALAAKYPVDSAFDDLWVEEAQKTGLLDGTYWQFAQDSKRKIANAAAKQLMQHPTAPLGYDGTPARFSRDGFLSWQDRALNADKAVADAFIVWLEQQYGKGRFDAYAAGFGWFRVATTATRADYFAHLASLVARYQDAPARLQFPALSALSRLVRPEDLTDAERATLRTIVTQCTQPGWWSGWGYEELVGLLQKKGSVVELTALTPELWRIAKNTGNGNTWRQLVQWADAQFKAKEYDFASAISAAGLEIMGGNLTADMKTALVAVRSQSLISIGGAIPVDRGDPRYPAFAAQAAFNAGNLTLAWEQYLPTAEKLPGLIKELDPKFTIWLINQNARNQKFERAETLARTLVPWLESVGNTVDPETRAQLLIAYANISFERREYPKARALFERIVTAEEFAGIRAKEEAELRVAEVDRLNKQFDSAFDLLDKLTRRKDKSVQTEAFYQLAQLKYEQEEFPAARRYLDQVFLREPDYAEGRILEGNLDLKMKRYIEATQVKVGLTTNQRLIVPGKPLQVRLEDQNLSIVGKSDSIEIRAWTDSGDEEIFRLVPFGDSKTKFEGALPTVLAPTVKGDRQLQVLGGDTVRYDFSEPFKKSHNITSEPLKLTVVSDSEMYVSSGRILTKEEIARQQLEEILLPKNRAEKDETEKVALSFVRPPDQIKPGNKINVRVIDPDRSATAGKDKITVRVSTTSGDSIKAFELTETETHSGVFEGAIPTVAAQAMATASNSEEGKQPNFPISAGENPAWSAAPDNVRPKLYAIDLNDNVALGKLTVKSDVGGRKLKRFALQTSFNGQVFTTLATWPETIQPWDGSLTLSYVKIDPATRPKSLSECRDALQKVAAPVQVPVKSLAVNLNQLVAADSYVAHLRGAFYFDARQSRTFRLHAPTGHKDVRYFFAIDDELARSVDRGPLEIKKSFTKGVHRLDVYVVVPGKADANFAVQWDIDKEPYIATCPVEVFAHPAIKPAVQITPATVTAAGDNTSFELAFAPKTHARVLRFVLDDFEGDAPAISRVLLTDASGKQILPTQQDLTRLFEDQVLQVIPGDKISITYDDPRSLTEGNNVRQGKLGVTYENATIHACYAVLDAARNARYVPVRRFQAGDPVTVVIVDPDRDTTEKQDVVQFTATTTGGKPVTINALETEEHSGVFVGNIFPVKTAPQRATELQVKEADDITVSYTDTENTNPGVPWDRTDSIEQATYVEPQLRLYEVTSRKSDNAQGVAQTVDNETFTATRSLLAVRPAEVAGKKPTAALLDGPVYAEVLFPTIALSKESQTVLYAQTSSARKKAGKTDADPFDINVPGTIKLTVGAGNVTERTTAPGYIGLVVKGDPAAITPLDDGRFSFSIPIRLGETPAKTQINETAVTLTEPLALMVRGGDEIVVGYEYKDNQGQTKWLTGQVVLGSDAFLDVMDRKYDQELTGAHVGESIYFRVMDTGKDVSAAKDEVMLTVKASSGASRTIKLSETFEHTGLFKGHLNLVHVQDQTDTNSPVVLPVQYGDSVTLGYAGLQRTVAIYKGADGVVLPFTKRFKDPEMAVRTQFTVAESFFELAKKHRELGEESLARREISQGKKVLEEALRDYPETQTKAQADYLLANLALEFANIAVDENLKKQHFVEAVGRFTDIVATYPDSQYAPKAQFKKALTFEKMGEIDKACEEYVKLSYRYPDNELVADTILRLGQYFFTKAKGLTDKIAATKEQLEQEKLKRDMRNMFTTAAEVFGRLSLRFPAHNLSGKSIVLSAQCYMRAEDYRKAITVFRRLVDDANSDKDARSEAMYWCGDSYMKIAVPPKEGAKADPLALGEAYRLFKRLTWDYPESKWAKFARGRLTEGALAETAEKDQQAQ